MKLFFTLLIFISFLVGCTAPEPNSFQQIKVKKTVTDVKFRQESFDGIKSIGQTTDGEQTDTVVNLNTGEELRVEKTTYAEAPRTNYFEEFRHLYNFADKQELQPLKNKLNSELAKIYRNSSHMSRGRIGDSPYADVFSHMASKEYRSATNNLMDMFERQGTIVLSLLENTKIIVPLPAQPVTLTQAFDYATHFIKSFEDQVRNHSRLEQALKDGVTDALNERFWLRLPKAKDQIAEFQAASQLDEAVEVLLRFIQDFEIELTDAEAEQLGYAQEIGSKLYTELTPKETFALIIDIWEEMAPAEREEVFNSLSPELHEYLDARSEKARDCLKRRKCGDVFLKIARNLFILPEIKKFGIENIQSEISKEGFAMLNAELQSAIYPSIQGMSQMLYNEIKAELDKEYQYYYGLRDTFRSFSKQEINNWFQKEFGRTTLPTYEDASLVMGRNYQSLKKSETTKFDAKVLGDALATSSVLFESGLVDLRKLSLIKVNQLLAHGGYNNGLRADVETLARRRGSPSLPVNVEEDVVVNTYLSYHSGAPMRGYNISRPRVRAKLKGSELVAMMRGLRTMVNVFADWKPSMANQIENSIKAKHLFPGFDHPALNTTVLPKDAMLALAVGNMALTVANFGSKGSPLFYHCIEGVNAWISEGEECESLSTTVSFNPDRSTTKISTKDQAELLTELIEIYKSADELKNTQSKYLNPQDGSDKPIDQLSDAKEQLSDLIFGLSQFLSSVLMDQWGRVTTTYDIGSREGNFESIDIRTYLSVISALSKVSQLKEAPVYAKNALAIFNYMYLALYDEEQGFFKESSSKPSRLTRVMALSALEDLLLVLDDEQYVAPLELLKEKWVKALKDEL